MADVEGNKDRHQPISHSQGSGKMSPGLPMHESGRIDHKKCRYPYCIVWTPIPMLTWLFPPIGHMGICTSQGIIRDFAGPYCVSEDNMAFGNPTKYWQLTTDKIPAFGTRDAWDRAVYEASEEYKGRMHNLCCDNCHSHVAFALNLMKYDNKTSWGMVKLAAGVLVHGKHVSFGGFLRQWAPFLVICTIIIVAVALSKGL